MTIEQIKHVIIHGLQDSLIIFGFVFVVYFIFSFIEVKIAKVLSKDNKLSPLFGSLCGLIPQCGVSVVASDLYLKRHITMGTIIAIFLACSDEAIPLLIANFSEKSLMVIPLIIIKFIIGFIIGFIVDLLIKDKKEVHEHLGHCEHEEEVHVGCCHHHIDDEQESKIKKYFVHPLIHSLKIFAYVLVINLVFGFIVEGIGEENIASFLQTNRYLSPLFTTFIGLIPNCASSVIVTELYVLDGISFGACLSGLLMNSGLGLIYLLKSKKTLKNTLSIILICFGVSIVVGYLTCLIIGF